jgi:hypothetical protein
VDEVSITLLMENVIDLLLPSTEGVERAGSVRS